MLIEELYEYYGSWANLSRKLGLGSTTYLAWRKRGYIPYPTQCVIEMRTKRKFKANIKHAKDS